MMPVQGNRAALKQATQAVHQRAEVAWIGDAGFCGLAGYQGWLGAMQRIHLQVGQAAAAALSGLDLAAERRRLACLGQDLGTQAKGLQARAPSVSWAWGVQYALNGSALGAAMLLKSGQVGQDWPRAYLAEMQAFAQSGGLRAFFDRLETVALDRAAAIAGAHAAFPMNPSAGEAT